MTGIRSRRAMIESKDELFGCEPFAANACVVAGLVRDSGKTDGWNQLWAASTLLIAQQNMQVEKRRSCSAVY